MRVGCPFANCIFVTGAEIFSGVGGCFAGGRESLPPHARRWGLGEPLPRSRAMMFAGNCSLRLFRPALL